MTKIPVFEIDFTGPSHWADLGQGRANPAPVQCSLKIRYRILYNYLYLIFSILFFFVKFYFKILNIKKIIK